MSNQKQCNDSWNIAIRKGREGELLYNTKAPFLVQKNGYSYWVADPIVFEYSSRVYVFAEYYSYWRMKGCIAVSEIKNKKLTKWKIIIKEPFHMSYPFVFVHNGSFYMIPETNGSNSLRLYESKDFPYRWKFVKDIITDVKWVDTTLCYENGMVVGYTRAHNNPDKDLKIVFDSELNIVSLQEIVKTKIEVDSYRCGGNIFLFNNEMIHPCQDESKGYGSGLIFRHYEVAHNLEVSVDRFCPKDIRTDSDMNWIGIHTYSANGGWEVIDLKSERFNYIETFMKKVRRFIRRVRKKRQQIMQMFR